MLQYTVTRVNGSFDWDQIPALPLSNRLWTPECDISAEARLCWDDEAIHVRMRAVEKNIRATHTAPLSQVCEDSCLEFFFSPVEGDKRYINIEFNPNCCICLGFGYCRQDRMRLTPKGDPFGAVAQRTDDGWQITYRIPFSFIKVLFPEFAPQTGKTMAANLYKCGDLTAQPHFFSWNHIPLEKPDFHCSQFFGQLIFG